MPDHAFTPPNGWSETSDAVSGSERTDVPPVDDGERVPVGLASPSNDPDDTRLEVASIDGFSTVERHGFVVVPRGGEQDGVEQVNACTRLVSETVPSKDTEDEGSLRPVRRCIEAFDTTTHDRRSVVTRGDEPEDIQTTTRRETL